MKAKFSSSDNDRNAKYSTAVLGGKKKGHEKRKKKISKKRPSD
jgi:hypothetical protein